MKKSILIVTNSFPYGKGESFFENELKCLADYYDEIYLLPNKVLVGSLLRELHYNNVTVCAPLYKNKLLSYFRIIFNSQSIWFIIRELLYSFRSNNYIDCLSILIDGLRTRAFASILISVIKKESKNREIVLYFYWANIPANAVVLLHRRIKCIVRYHGGDLYEELYPKNVIYYRKSLLKSAALNIFVSNFGLEYITRKYNNLRFNYIVNRLGVTSPGLSQRSTDNYFRIMSCSNITANKRVHLIVEALKLINFEVIWCHFGDGPLIAELKSQVLSIPSNICCRIFGATPNSAILDYYIKNPVDLFINVSISEGIPVSIMEAISTGIPVFATDVGGVHELIDETCGVLLNPDIEASEIAEKITMFKSMDEIYINNIRLNAFKKYNEIVNANTQNLQLLTALIGLMENKYD